MLPAQPGASAQLDRFLCIYGKRGYAVFTSLYGKHPGKEDRRKDSRYPCGIQLPLGGGCENRAKDTGLKLALRIPDWCSRYELDGFTGGTEEKDDYLYLQKDWGEEEEFTLHFPMEVRMIAAKEAVREDIGKVAVMRGPVVYCLEETDNGKDLQKLLIAPELNVTVSDGNICGTPVKKLTAAGFRQLDTHIEKESEALYHVWKKPEFEKAELSYIPYYTWANRGENEMQVWTRVRD